MKKIITFLLAIGFSCSSFAETKAERACYKVEGMTCAACSITLKAAVKKLDGISKVEVSVDDKNAVIDFDPQKTNTDAIGKKIDSVGYKSEVKKCS